MFQLMVGSSDHECRNKKEEVSPLLPSISAWSGKGAQKFLSMDRSSHGIYQMPLGCSRGPYNLAEKGHSGQSGQLGLQPHFPSLPQPH